MTFQRKQSQRCCRGLTLAELLIASVLVGVVAIGAAGVMIGMRRIQGSSSLASFLVIHSSAVMAHIQRNVLQATGYQSDLGIILSPGSSPPYYSFRQDANSSGTSNNTPADYSDDTWIIYVLDPAETLSYCLQAASSGSVPTAACLSGAMELTNRVQSLTFTFVANAVDFYVEVDLQTISDPASAQNPMTNPSYSLTTKITPVSHTW